MPKRTPHGRPAKSKNRTRRPAATRPGPAGGSVAMPVQEPTMGVGPEMTLSAGAVATAAQRAPTPTASRRVSSSARRAPTVTFNYAYLSRDMRYLLVLAPAMVVLLILAYIFLH